MDTQMMKPGRPVALLAPGEAGQPVINVQERVTEWVWLYATLTIHS